MSEQERRNPADDGENHTLNTNTTGATTAGGSRAGKDDDTEYGGPDAASASFPPTSTPTVGNAGDTHTGPDVHQGDGGMFDGAAPGMQPSIRDDTDFGDALPAAVRSGAGDVSATGAAGTVGRGSMTSAVIGGDVYEDEGDTDHTVRPVEDFVLDNIDIDGPDIPNAAIPTDERSTGMDRVRSGDYGRDEDVAALDPDALPADDEDVTEPTAPRINPLKDVGTGRDADGFDDAGSVLGTDGLGVQ